MKSDSKLSTHGHGAMGRKFLHFAIGKDAPCAQRYTVGGVEGIGRKTDEKNEYDSAKSSHLMQR